MDSRQQKHYDAVLQNAKTRSYQVMSTRYENANTKLEFRCSQGHIFEMRARAFIEGHNCAKCMGVCPKQAKERFLFYALESGYQVIGNYVNNKDPIEIGCNKQHVFITRPVNFYNGDGCPKCSGMCQQQAEDNFRALVLARQHEIIGVYINTQTKIDLMCENQHFFSVIPNNYTKGGGCSTCSESYGEQLIRHVLNYLQIPFSRNHVFPFLPTRKYDFAFRIDNIGVIVIEWDGAQHFSFQYPFHDNEDDFINDQEIDILKTQQVLSHGYKMIRIDYTWLKKSIHDVANYIHHSIVSLESMVVSNVYMYKWLQNRVIIPRKIQLRITNPC
jgi:very-short-patch-repair endonuclease/ssDNA-binding Zn-finger/Zn-ribbon topoisomerase 1